MKEDALRIWISWNSGNLWICLQTLLVDKAIYETWPFSFIVQYVSIMIIYNLALTKGIKTFLEKNAGNYTWAITVVIELLILKTNLSCIRFAWKKVFDLYVGTN